MLWCDERGPKKIGIYSQSLYLNITFASFLPSVQKEISQS